MRNPVNPKVIIAAVAGLLVLVGLIAFFTLHTSDTTAAPPAPTGQQDTLPPAQKMLKDPAAQSKDGGDGAQPGAPTK